MAIKSSRKLFVQARRFHYLVGLFLLAELWIFVFSGLMLNHPQWQISQFWGRRTTTHRRVPLPELTAAKDEDRAVELMNALGISGELESISWSSNTDGYSLTVARPAFITRIVIDKAAGLVEIDETSTDSFGLVSMLHTFNGVDLENGGRERDWIVTSAWTATMDLLSAALIFWALSGFYLWIAAGRRERVSPGYLRLQLGWLWSCFF